MMRIRCPLSRSTLPMRWLSLLLCLGASLALSIADGAQALITATGGAAVQIGAPANSRVGMLQSNTSIFVWEEKQNHLTVNVLPFNIDGTPGFYDTAASVAATAGNLPANSPVDSHMIHFDQLGPGTTTLSGSVEFQHPITAVFVLCDPLDGSDTELGSPVTLYPNCIGTGDFRPVDWVSTGDTEQIIISPDRMKIDFTLRTSNVLDQLRVVTQQSAAVAAAPGLGFPAVALLVLLGIALGTRILQKNGLPV
ncbi:MAG: hypothetical protein CL933_20655 [Deltaproteobacteria bacterium]|nr:hypothetical protein [Deltaproteobacteria bacterium]